MKTKHSRIYPLAVICMLFVFTLNCRKDDRIEVSFAGGIGTRADPYLIETPEQLFGVRHYPDQHFKQVADLDLKDFGADAGWLPIGNIKNQFTGTFDGNGYKITNLTINSPEINYVGLFGYTQGNTIKNVVLEDINISGGNYPFDFHVAVGGLVGSNGGKIINCHVTGNVAGKDIVGGLAGFSWGDITDSYASADVSGENYLGGLVGWVNWGDIINCFATGNVSGNEHVGGLVGKNRGNITNSYATGSVSGDRSVGGLAGWIFYGNITDSYATGSVSGDDGVGGLAGVMQFENITNSYATGSVSGSKNTGGLVGWNAETNIDYSYYDKETTGQDDTDKGIPKTTVEMMRQSTFENWDFSEIWAIAEGVGYPYLRWQHHR